MKITNQLRVAAEQILEQERKLAAAGDIDAGWAYDIQRFSDLCEEFGKTQIAFLGTSLLAKAVLPNPDLFAIKSKLGAKNAYSARSLCHSVLAPWAVKARLNLGATGPEPLNNQPFFRMHRLDDDTPIHAGAEIAMQELRALVKRVQKGDGVAARKALRAFIAVRLKRQRVHAAIKSTGVATADGLADAIKTLTREDSENGKRAQAAVAGLLDLLASPERVACRRVNDPSRVAPGDVRVLAEDGSVEIAMEVRDKRVTVPHAIAFIENAFERGASSCALVAVAANQDPLVAVEVLEWCTEHNRDVAIFMDWHALVRQALFWSKSLHPSGVAEAAKTIWGRLIALEVRPTTTKRWSELVGDAQ